jgi:hypothetical protein
LLLRTGGSKICALGIVASDYVYLNQFEDVNGWPLQHSRRVRWLPVDQEWPTAVFGGQPSRLARTNKKAVIEFALGFLHSEPSEWRNAPLPALPAVQRPLTEIPMEIACLAAEAIRLYPLYWNHDRFGDRPAEHELLCHFVVPFLKALGWPAELVAVEWRDIDVILFDKLPRNPQNVRMVLELKRFGSGIEGALLQAQGYCKALAIERDVVVADGIRYPLYPHSGQGADTHYANLANLKEPAKGLFDALRYHRC